MKKIIYKIFNFLFTFIDFIFIKKNKFFEINLRKINKKNNFKFSIENFLDYLFNTKTQSKSQIFQDLFVDFLFKKKNNKFYCDVGAADGVNLSNTYFLEKKRRWKGILCEPSLYWIKKLKSNRPNNILIFDAISNKSEQKIFYETKNKFLSGLNVNPEKSTKKYIVNTITLNDIFLKYKVKNIDYLSIDTEGNEIKVLYGLNFKKYRPKVISIEHNYYNEKKIYKILSHLNYELVFPYLSGFDSFYVCKNFLKKI